MLGTCCVVAALVQAGGNPRAAIGRASLLVNGSFEQAPVARSFLNLAGGTTAIEGWVVTGEGIDIVAASYWAASDGNYSLDLDGSRRSGGSPPYAHGGIAQTFATKPGARYLLSFDMAGNPVRPPALKPMRISAAGQTVDFTFDITGKSGRNMGWLRKRWTFTAKDDSTTLEFRSLTVSPLTGFGPAIDNVAVTALGGGGQLEITENAKEIQVSLGAELLFATGKYALKPAATDALQRLVELLSGYPGLPILIEGHTDSVGTPEANRLLSERRANTVKEWLISKGRVTADRITSKGYGQSVPVAGNGTAAGPPHPSSRAPGLGGRWRARVSRRRRPAVPRRPGQQVRGPEQLRATPTSRPGDRRGDPSGHPAPRPVGWEGERKFLSRPSSGSSPTTDIRPRTTTRAPCCQRFGSFFAESKAHASDGPNPLSVRPKSLKL